jgi:ParB family transcriptional regulator, chromosome partitioning protein
VQTLFDMPIVNKKDVSAEWYTPKKYALAVCRAFGCDIDLDPASCAEANEIIQARRYYTRDQDGLKQSWCAQNVYLNPPYGTTGLTDHKRSAHSGKANIRLFLDKLLAEWQAGMIGQAIVLVRADPSAQWFSPLWQFPVCFVPGDIRFHAPGGKLAKHRFGSCFVYLGSRVEEFSEVFREYGNVVTCTAVQQHWSNGLMQRELFR